MATGHDTVVLHLRETAGLWFGLACLGEALLATAVSPTRARTIAALRRSLPAAVEHRLGGEVRPEFVERTLELLAHLEAGDERGKRFVLDSRHLGEPLRRVLEAAAAIPLGYVSTYGNVARAAGVEARDVGGIMARNPLYPIVACHRVVGADLALVGYAGSKSPAALGAKLARLRSEARGFATERDLPVGGEVLRVYPVERAIAKARDGQRWLFE
ncbi:MAG TPA: MGMT family protein [Vicinamibacteria bacterium]|nr:MGMT family protein [Vicinamibacteria bacterium]